MTNIHRIGDYRDRQANNRQAPSNMLPGIFQANNDSEFLRTCNTYRIPFFQITPFKPARQYNYCDFLTNTFCPILKCCSFTILICIIDLILFIAQLSVGLNASGQFLEVNINTLDRFKGLNLIALYKGEVYRVFTPIVLHANFMHIFGNLISTLILLSRVQYTYGLIYTVIIYFLSGISGNIFSAVVKTDYFVISVGASTSLYGLLGLLIGYMIINWNGLDFMGAKKCQLFCMLMMMLLFVIVLTSFSYSGTVDIFGHLGGFLGGLWLCGLPKPIIYETRQQILRLICFCMFCCQFSICFIVFYLGKPDLKAAASP